MAQSMKLWMQKLCFWLHIINGMMHVVWHQNSIDAKLTRENVLAPDFWQSFRSHMICCTCLANNGAEEKTLKFRWMTQLVSIWLETIAFKGAVLLSFMHPNRTCTTHKRTQSQTFMCNFIYANRMPDAVRWTTENRIHLWYSLFKCLFYSLALSFWHNFM